MFKNKNLNQQESNKCNICLKYGVKQSRGWKNPSKVPQKCTFLVDTKIFR